MSPRYAASTLASPWLAVGALVLLAQSWSSDQFMTGELLLAADNTALLVMLAGPVLAGVSAFDAARHFSPSRVGIFSRAVARRRESAWLLLWAAGPTAATLSVATAVRVAVELSKHGHTAGLPSAALTILLQVAALAFFASLGVLVGRALPPIIAGVVGLLVGYGVTILGAGERGVRFGPLDLGGASVSRLGLDLSPSFLALQGAMLLAVPLTVILAASVVPPATDQRIRRGTVGLGILGLLLVAPVPGLPPSRWVPKPLPPSSCSGENPIVCTYPEHVRQAELADAQIRLYVDALQHEGISALVPRSVQEISRTYAPGGEAGTRSADLSQYDDTVEARRSLVYDLVTPVHCPQLVADTAPSDAYFDIVDRLALTFAHVADPSVEATLWPTEPMTADEAEAAIDLLWACDFA